MFENFFRKPKSEQEQDPERIVELGKKTLLREVNLEIEPRRIGGHMLCTVMAMLLAIGAMTGEAEAQVRGVGPQGHGFGGQVASEVFRRGVSEIGSILNRNQNAKRDRIEHGYVAQLTQLEDAVGRLNHQYKVRRSRMMREGDNQGNLKTLENSYHTERVQLMKAKADLERGHHRQKRNTAITGELTEAIIHGARGR